MTRVLLLSNGDRLSLKVAFCLRAARMQLDVVACKWAPFTLSRHIRKFTTAKFPPENVADPAFTDLINSYIADNQIDCVLAADIDSLLLLANMKSGLKGAACFPISSSDLLHKLNDKFQVNQFLIENGLPAPAAVLLHKADDVFGSEFRSLTFPVIVKPVDNQAGRGVMRADTYDQLVDHVFGDGPFREMPMMIQNYLPGLDGGCSVLAQEGKVLMWAQQIYQPDGTIKFYQDDELLAVTKSIVELTKFTGVANFDVRIDQDSKLLGLIECNPRFWYSIPAAAAHGLNFVEAGIRLALGKEPAADSQSGYHCGDYYPLRAALRYGGRAMFGGGAVISRENFRELVREAVDIIPSLYTVIAEKTDRIINH